MAKRYEPNDDEDDVLFTPDDEDDTADESFVELHQAKSPGEFQEKASRILSNMMDVLDEKIRTGMAESSDFKTALELGKMFKVGIETVDEAAKRALNEAQSYEEVEEEDDLDVGHGMRFDE